MKNTILLFSLFLASVAIAQTNRKAFTLEMAADETHQYKMDVKESPYFVKDKMLQLYCGENLLVECEIAADTIASMKVVEKIIHPERTIEIKFSQEAEDRKNIGSTLLVKNPFKKKLKYNAHMFTPLGQQWTPTSIIPILPGLLGYEMWPHAIITLVLDEWKLEN